MTTLLPRWTTRPAVPDTDVFLLNFRTIPRRSLPCLFFALACFGLLAAGGFPYLALYSIGRILCDERGVSRLRNDAC